MKKIKNKRIKGGFTLLEIVIVIGLTASIFMAVFNFGQGIFNFNRNAQDNLSAQTNARRVLKTMVRELRGASPSSLGSYPIALASTTAITFFSNIDNDVYKEQVRYFLSGTNLKRGVIKPSGSPLVYNAANEQITTLITDINNDSTPIFDYFNSFYAGTSTPLAQPVQATAVRFIKITIKIQKDPQKSIGLFKVESQVALRNLKDNL